jgi:TRAP-type C4-dicarboxylate transport system substrate-binding protein
MIAKRSRRLLALVVGATLVACLGGCTTTGTKAGAGLPPVTLILGTPDAGAQIPYRDELELFARRVSELSRDRLRVETRWGPEEFHADDERRLAESVAGGNVDLALLPTRVYSAVGIHRFDALQTPFLIQSVPLAVEVAASPLGEKLLDAVGPGRVGLGIFYESLRRPAGYPHPLVGPADFAGARVRIPDADSSRRLLGALGADPVSTHDYQVDDNGGVLVGVESAFDWYDALPKNAVMTANVIFYPKFDTLVAGAGTWQRLSDDERRVLRTAARDTVAETRRSATDVGAANSYCESGRQLAWADAKQLAALHALAQPVTAALEADPDTAADIATITSIAARVQAAPFTVPPACAARTGDSAPWPTGK